MLADMNSVNKNYCRELGVVLLRTAIKDVVCFGHPEPVAISGNTS